MALTKIRYNNRALESGLNVYFIAEGDREGNIRLERHVPANPCCNCYSVAKAFTVTAVGLLYDKGLLKPEMKIADIFGDLLPADADPKWQQVTVHDLLLHKAGFGTSGLLDIDSDDASAYGTTDYLSLIFSTPLVHEPGTTSVYTDAAYYLLSRVVAQVSGIDLADLLRPVLMDTMGFKEFAWSVCPQGYAMGATGLYLRTEDMVKLGILYLNKGFWKGTRILSEEWVDLVLANHYEFKDQGNGWLGKGGMCGQMLTFHMEKGLAVAWHSYDYRVKHNKMIR